MEDKLAGIRDAIDDRLGTVQAAADEASRLVRNLTFIFLLVGLYVFIIAAGTDDETLFRDGDIQMPLLNVGVPVSSFYFLVPPLFLLLHFNLLLQYFFLSRKLHALNAVRSQLLHGRAALEEHRELVFPLPFSQLIAGRQHGPAVVLLLRVMVWVILVGLPVALLLWLQLRFLPFQDPWIVSVHRLVILLDLVVIWMVYPRLPRRSGDWRRWFEERYPLRTFGAGPKSWSVRLPGLGRMRHAPWPAAWRERPRWWRWMPDAPALATPATLGVLFFAVFIAVHPYGPVERVTPFLDGLRAGLFDQPGSYLHRALDVSRKILVAEEPSAELVALYVGSGAGAAANPDEADDAAARRARRSEAFREHATTLTLEGRSFRNARLLGVELFSAELANAELQGADLRLADLQEVSLRRANLQSAFLLDADLRGANLSNADLRGADLSIADLQGVSLRRANLQGADFSIANLQGADLSIANLQRALLGRAQLQGAVFRYADLQGAVLVDADLLAADLQATNLQGAVLRYADLRGADLRSADLRGADLKEAELWRADLGTEAPFAARLELVDLRGVRVNPMVEEEVAALIASVAEEIGDQRVRQRVVERLKKRFGDESSSGLELPPRLTTADPVPVRLVEGSELADLLGETMAPEDYEQALGEHLAGLSCGEESNRYVAEGVAQRAFIGAGETLARVLAAALLDDGCKGFAEYLATLSEEGREEKRQELERFAQMPGDAGDGG